MRMRRSKGVAEYRTIIDKNRHMKAATPYYINAHQRKTLITMLGDASYVLFSFYLEKAHSPNFTFADDKVAKILGFSERKVKRTRLQLTRYGWFLQSTYTDKTGRKVVITFLGQESVSNYKESKRTRRITEVDASLLSEN